MSSPTQIVPPGARTYEIHQSHIARTFRVDFVGRGVFEADEFISDVSSAITPTQRVPPGVGTPVSQQTCIARTFRADVVSVMVFGADEFISDVSSYRTPTEKCHRGPSPMELCELQFVSRA